MRSIVRSIYEHSLEWPEKTAIIAADHTVDYATLWKLIVGAATLLKRKGIEPGQRVLLEADHTVEYLALTYGIQLAGAVHVPIENSTPEKRIEEISREIDPALVLVGKHPLAHLGVSLMELLDVEPAAYTFPTEDMLQEILFTTGTTGKSKGVMGTHGAQMNRFESSNEVLDYSVDNVWLIPTPMNHAAGIRKVHMSMVKGSTVVLMNGFTNLKLFFQAIREHHVTSIYLPPSGVHYILMLASKELAKYNDQLDFLYSSSTALPSGDKEKLMALLPDVRKFDIYGSSETGAACCIDYNAEKVTPGCVGGICPGVEVFTVDEDHHPVEASAEEPGIIAIRSNAVMAGYWNEPDLTAKTVQDGVVYMSDVGYVKDGYLYLLGRQDAVINVGGLKVAPTEVEDVAMRHPMVDECVCVPFENKVVGRVIKMYVTLNEGFSLNVDELMQHLREHLEAYKLPKIIEEIAEIPHTYNGKIDRKKLLAEQK